MSPAATPLARSLAAVVAAWTLITPAAHAEALDGRSYDGIFVARGQTRGDADTVSFRNGRLRSSACDRYGYSDAPYTTTGDGQAIRFEAETVSPKYGRLRWTGYVRGDRLDATVIRLQDGKAPVEHWVAAALKP